MNVRSRLQAASRACLKHFILSLIVAAATAALVFQLWYPYPYREISGGRDLFFLLMQVDVVAGPLLTLMVYSPSKARKVWLRDISVILVLQLAALCYGLYTLAEARPVRLVFEGNRFRAVTLAELDSSDLSAAPPELRQIGWTGPRLIGAQLLRPTDPGYVQSIRAAIEGLPPSLRPERWVDYSAVSSDAVAASHPLDSLLRKHPSARGKIENELASMKVVLNDVGYLPLVSRTHDDWATLIDRRNGAVLLHVHLDAW